MDFALLTRLATPVVLALALAFSLSQCLLPASRAASPPSAPAPAPAPLPPGVKSLEVTGLHNVFAISTNIFSGNSPESDAAFAELARLGVKTILSVDGAKPDVEEARRHGLRYVHLPHGYDGIDPALQARLIQAGRMLPGPIYVHCHHGKHRGPVAAAVMCLGNQGWDRGIAESYLHAAGTATHYLGLYRTVRDFRMPSADALRAAGTDFPESARVPGIVEAMVDIDARWEHLKAIRQSGYRAPKDHPDLVPAQEALLLREAYREARRLPDCTKVGPDLLARFEAAEADAAEAERLLRAVSSPHETEARRQLDGAFDRLGQTCSSCHVVHRDRPKQP